jgi:O-Antigen ligase
MDATELTADPDGLTPPAPVQPTASPGQALRVHGPAIPVFIALPVMILWSAHDGGFDEDTWYWGALVMLALLVVSVVIRGTAARPLTRPLRLALAGFAGYVAWSYASIAWARSPADALTGSNRALMYLILFALFALAPWTVGRVRLMLLGYTAGVSGIGLVLLVRMVIGGGSWKLFEGGRLLVPTGYINSNAALFTSVAFVAIGLAVRKDLPSVARGVLLAVACEGLQLALLAESRGWLFLLPVMIAAAIIAAADRLRTTAAAILPTLGALAVLPPILHVFEAVVGDDAHTPHVGGPAQHAARLSLLACAVVAVLGTALALADRRGSHPGLSARSRRVLGAVAAVLVSGGFIAAGVVVTHGHPLRFIKRQLNTTTQVPTTQISHFSVAGTERYDIWRVALDALRANPIGGLGQDNFIEYYYRHRHTTDEPRWTHSFELRLLAHTGVVGFILMVAALAGALAAAITTRRRGPPVMASLAGVALFPFVVWLIHGSVDWFWEIPALSGPALGFLAMAGAFGMPRAPADAEGMSTGHRRRRTVRAAAVAAAVAGVLAAVVVLGFPYLSVREVSIATNIRTSAPAQALTDLRRAAGLNPLNPIPPRLAGVIALQIQRPAEAQARFRQSIARDSGSWFAWLGAGLAASELGQKDRARRDFATAESIDAAQPAVRQALRRINSPAPLEPSEAFKLLLSVQ